MKNYSNMKKVAITGTTRGIGAAIKNKLTDYELVELNRPQFDLSIQSTILPVNLEDIDVLILNAGLANKSLIPNLFIDQSLDYWQNIIKSQILGNFTLLQKYLQSRNQGVVVVLSSIVVEESRFSGRAVYTVAKTALSCLLNELRHEIKRQNQKIRIIDIKPGLTRDSGETPIDGENRLPSTYDQVADAIVFAINHPTVTKITFNNL